MSLLTPLALALSALAVPIILMYVLKLRRQERVVPSTFLWRRALEDVQANAPWQRLRFNILLLLQLLALAALVFALARPAYSKSSVLAGDVVVIVDQSYGMQAHDVLPSRFADALRRAHALASDLGGDNVMSVIGMGGQPHLVIADSSDHGAIDRAIDGLHAGVDQPNFLGALSLAASLARSGQSTQAIVLTSRDSGISGLPLAVDFPVDIVRIGGRLHDLGITAFSAAQHSAIVQAVARVSNFGSDTAKSDLELYADGQLQDVRPLSVEGHHQQDVVWTDLPGGVSRLQVRLSHRDNVDSDKTAWAVVPGAATRNVLLVSTGDYFLQTALLLDPSVKLTVMPPSAYAPGRETAYDLVVFDGNLPPLLPNSPTLLVAPPSGHVGPLRFTGTRPTGLISVSDAGTTGPLAGLLKYVDLSDVHVAQARSIALPGWLNPLASSNGQTLLAAGDRNGARFALVSFDLQRSDWPLRISFPIVLQNVLHYLAPGLTLGATDVTTGQSVSFVPPPGTRALKVVRPDGAAQTLRPPFPPFTDTSRPGVYTVERVGAGTNAAGTAGDAFAVNFFPSRPAPAGGPTSLHLGHARASKSVKSFFSVDVAWMFCLAALALLGLEWWVAFRGAGLGSRVSGLGAADGKSDRMGS